MMKKGFIRPLALCVFRKGDEVLVESGYDPIKDETFYRPLGGGIEFGEYSHVAVVREIQEEIGASIKELRLLGTLENIFTFEGRPGHEIVQVYQAEFTDPSMFERNEVMGREDDGSTIRATWKPMGEFREGRSPLYPDGLLELLDG